MLGMGHGEWVIGVWCLVFVINYCSPAPCPLPPAPLLFHPILPHPPASTAPKLNKLDFCAVVKPVSL